MKRTLLTELITQAARQQGYTPYSGAEARLDETAKAFPALWLSPAKLTGCSGRNEGYLTYRIEIFLAHTAGKMTPEAKDALWDRMETDAVGLYCSVAADPAVRQTRNLTCTPDENALTRHATLSMKVGFEVEIPFC